MAVVVIGNAYTSTLTSFLTAPKLKPIINSLEELAASDHYKLTSHGRVQFRLYGYIFGDDIDFNLTFIKAKF